MKLPWVAWVVLPVLPCHAELSCSESPGSCNGATPMKSSLMQLRSVQRKAEEAQTVSAKLAGFQQFTEKMIAQFGQEPSEHAGIDDESDKFNEVLPAVAMVLGFIRNMYDVELLPQHQLDLARIKACNESLETCVTTHLNATEQAFINGLQTTANADKEKHETCRETRSTVAQNAEQNCIAYDTYRQNFNHAEKPTCVGDLDPALYSHGNSYWMNYLKAQFGSPDLKKMETCLDETQEWLYGPPPDQPTGDKKPLFPLYRGCDRGGAQCGEEAHTCRSNQHTFETSHCSYNLEKNLRCGNVYNCWNGTETFCAEQCPLVKANGEARAADNETGMRLECLLQVLFGKYNGTHWEKRLEPDAREIALNNCKTYDYDEVTKFWLIECPPFHAVPLPIDCTCSSVSNSTEFLQENYFKMPDPGLGQICTQDEEQHPSTRLDCCINKNISKPINCQIPVVDPVHCAVR